MFLSLRQSSNKLLKEAKKQRESGVPGCGQRAGGAAGWGGRSSVWGSCRRRAAARRLSGLGDSRCDPPLRVSTPPDGTCTRRRQSCSFSPRNRPPQSPDREEPSCTENLCLLLSWFSFITAPTERTLQPRLTAAGARTALWAAPEEAG